MPWPSSFFLRPLIDERRQINKQHHWVQVQLRDDIEPRKQEDFSSAYLIRSGHLN